MKTKGATRHNPGSLKQSNKRHKGVGSKRQLNRDQGAGRVESSKSKTVKESKTPAKGSRQQRMNRAQQLRKQKTAEMLLQKRIGSSHGAPRIVGVIPLSAASNAASVVQSCSTTGVALSSQYSGVRYLNVEKQKSRLCLLESSFNLERALDVARVSDIVVFSVSIVDISEPEETINSLGDDILTALKALGCPSMICCVEGLKSVESDAKRVKHLHRFLAAALEPDVKIVDANDGQQLTRYLSTMAVRAVHWRSNKSYLTADGIKVESQLEVGNDQNSTCRVQLSGFLRGRPLHVHSLGHIVGVGTCRVDRIIVHGEKSSPYTNSRENNRNDRDMTLECEFINTSDHENNRQLGENVYVADPSKQDSLMLEAIGDSISGEQTWPLDTEIQAMGAPTDAGRDRRVLPNEVPTGMSSYQADWFVDEEGRFETPAAENGEHRGDESDDDFDLGDGGSLLDAPVDAATAVAEKKRLAAEDKAFPDEMDTPGDVSVRARFARYRCLQSFRSSPWHPKENLPQEYSRIFQFEDFNGMQRRILGESQTRQEVQDQEVLGSLKSKSSRSKSRAGSFHSRSTTAQMMVDEQDEADQDAHDNEECDDSGDAIHGEMTCEDNEADLEDFVMSGQYVTICLDNVNISITQLLLEHRLVSFFGLLPHENKLSVLNFDIQRTPGHVDDIKSKDELIFMTGHRSFVGRPVFSEANLNCDKNKLERFFLPDRFSVASVFGPVSYQPCPVLIFKRRTDAVGGLRLVATGSLGSVNPDRIVLKKVILTGVPIRVRKRFAVVKHLFYDPQDVRWFKPAELATKMGLRGHIREPVGTHGLLKASFSGAIKQNDTVMLVLYKRVFPKFPSDGVLVF